MFHPSRFLKIFSGIFLLVGLNMLGVTGFLSYQNYLTTAQYSRAMGTVIRNVSGDTTRAVVEFQAADGKTYTVTSSVGSDPPAHQVGDEVEVMYPSDRPDEAQLNTFLELWFISLIFGGMGLVFSGIGGGILGYDWYRQKIVTKLKEIGTALETQFVSVNRNTSLEVNGSNPFQIVTQYEDKPSNKVYVFKSDNLWFDPTEYVEGKTITVLVNPTNYGEYYVDTSFLPNLA